MSERGGDSPSKIKPEEGASSQERRHCGREEVEGDHIRGQVPDVLLAEHRGYKCVHSHVAKHSIPIQRKDIFNEKLDTRDIRSTYPSEETVKWRLRFRRSWRSLVESCQQRNTPALAVRMPLVTARDILLTRKERTRVGRNDDTIGIWGRLSLGYGEEKE